MIMRSSVLVLGAVAFGAVDALLWSWPQTFWLANLSAAYVVLAFGGGWVADGCSLPRAAAAGAGVTVVALLAFYGVQAWQQVGGSSFDQVRFTRYAVPGLVTGVLSGALGGLWARSRTWWVLVPVALALLLEPLAWRLHLGFDPGASWTWDLERAAGLAVLVLALWRAAAQRRTPNTGTRPWPT